MVFRVRLLKKIVLIWFEASQANAGLFIAQWLTVACTTLHSIPFHLQHFLLPVQTLITWRVKQSLVVTCNLFKIVPDMVSQVLCRNHAQLLLYLKFLNFWSACALSSLWFESGQTPCYSLVLTCSKLWATGWVWICFSVLDAMQTQWFVLLP